MAIGEPADKFGVVKQHGRLPPYGRRVGITPPDPPEFTWGAVMGGQEAAAWSSAAEVLELAVASGVLVPGRRGWKARQQELVRAHLDAPREELLGQPLAAVIVSERAETWRALGLLAPGSDWPDRRCELTAAGTATALEALRARATGPRTLT